MLIMCFYKEVLEVLFNRNACLSKCLIIEERSVIGYVERLMKVTESMELFDSNQTSCKLLLKVRNQSTSNGGKC